MAKDSSTTLEEKLTAKLKNLNFMEAQTAKILDKGDLEGIGRQLSNLQTKVSEIYDLKIEVQEAKFLSKETEESIIEWSAQIESEIAKVDKTILDLKNFEKQINEKAKEESFRDEMNKEKAKLEQKFEYELKAAIEHNKAQDSSNNKVNTKLPKLEISPFNGSVLDFNRFVGLFEAEIERSQLAPVTKFAYLKELVVPKVRSLIDGLPFTSEGYERAKNILKTKYGKESEIVNAHMQGIISLPVIQGSNPSKISDFYEMLLMHVQALETMGRLREVNGYVRVTLDKLPGIRADLVRLDDDWHDWRFHHLVEALRKWCERNPSLSINNQESNQGFHKTPGQGQTKPHKRERSFQARDETPKVKQCVYCNSTQHKAVDCDKVKGVAERRKVLSDSKLCFNCASGQHRAGHCRSKTNCQNCSGRHHTSICDKGNTNPTRMLASREEAQDAVVYPVVVVNAGGIICRALLDTGAGGSYASSQLIEKLGNKPIRSEYKQIDMMLTTINKKVSVYKLGVENIDGDFKLDITVNRVERDTLLNIPNPHYKEMINKHAHLKGVEMEDDDKKEELPVHLILGTSEISKIKTQTRPRVGHPGEPIAELTKYGWVIMSPGVETDTSNFNFAQTSTAHYDKLCSLDILGLEDKAGGDQRVVHETFKQQLKRTEGGWYETGLLWKPDIPDLPNNKAGSLARLHNLVKRLERSPELLNECKSIIEEQQEAGIIEEAPEKVQGREFYLPFKPVVRESAESTKTRLVYDGSARATSTSPSLNDCLETGPPLQNLIFDITARNRFHPVTLSGDIKKAFLSVRVKEEDRDALRFHFIDSSDSNKIKVYRFTRALFGLNQSPFLLGGTLDHHLSSYSTQYPSEVDEIKRSLYVDDLILGGTSREEVQNLKDTAVQIFESADFHLHKWHSNVPALELSETVENCGEEVSFAKTQLNVHGGETKLLGLSWDTETDKLAVMFPRKSDGTTLSSLAGVYDPLGLASPITVLGKMIYRDVCDRSTKWDEELPADLAQRWNAWNDKLPEKLEVMRCIAHNREPIQAIDLHGFGDTSGNGTSAAVYAVIAQESGTSQGLVAAKSRLAKKGLTIPRLELVAGQMVARLTENVRIALQGMPVRNCHGWLDSTVALYWINGQGSYKQFVSNRVEDIKKRSYITWRHVSTEENPADVGSRGCYGNKLPQEWLNGPAWLAEPENWRSQSKLESSKESESEAQPVKREQLKVADEKEEDVLDKLLAKYTFWKTMRITAWVKRFMTNTRVNKRNKQKGVLTTREVQAVVQWWVKRIQQRHSESDQMKEDTQRLNLQKNKEGLFECRGRIEGHYPIYVPPNTLLAEKLVMDAHTSALHGGVGITMATVREGYWIPRLRYLAKRLIKCCYGCKRFRATHFPNPPVGNLPSDRTSGSRPFQVVGIDYAGPIMYKSQKDKEAKSYVLLISCSLTRAVHLEVVPDLTVSEFKPAFKRFMARRGRPETVYSDNAQTFGAAAKWIKQIMRNEEFNDYIARLNINWKFNLSKAPWWGGQFERLIGLVKQAMYKVVAKAVLRWKELQEVMLDVEVSLNNRPLTYVEDDVELPVLTPSLMVNGQHYFYPDNDEDTEEEDLRKRARYLKRCKDQLWKRWTGEYVRALRERHNQKHSQKEMTPQLGEVVLIHGDEKNRGKWSFGVVKKLYQGRDGVVRGVQIKTPKSTIDRPVQLLYPLELAVTADPTEARQLNPDANEFRPQRRAAQVARENIASIQDFEANA